MSNMKKIDPFQSDSVMSELGEVVPVILREAMDSGFDAFRRSRDLDPVGFAAYGKSTLANMLADRIYTFLISLTAAADFEGQQLRTRQTHNGRATELWIGSELYVKVKRVRDSSRSSASEDDLEVDGDAGLEIIEEGMPRNVRTARVVRQLSPRLYTGSQLPLPGIPPVQIPDDGRDRICLIAGYDLDLTEERMERHRIGLYSLSGGSWSIGLPELEVEAIARISPTLSEQVAELRQVRRA